MQHICNIIQYGQVFVQCAYAFIISQLPCSRVHIYASAFEGFAQAHTRFFEEATKVGIYRVTVVTVTMRLLALSTSSLPSLIPYCPH